MFTELFNKYTIDCLKEIESVLNDDFKIAVIIEYNVEDNKINLSYNDSLDEFTITFEKPALLLTDTLKREISGKTRDSGDETPKIKKYFGLYDSSQNTISLNVKSIERKAKMLDENAEDFLKVIYCHEFFHAIHHKLANAKSGDGYWEDNKSNGDARTIIEAIANVVMLRVCKHVGVDSKFISSRIYEKKDCEYKEATQLICDIIKNDPSALDKAAYIFKKSLKSWRDAMSFLKWINGED